MLNNILELSSLDATSLNKILVVTLIAKLIFIITTPPFYFPLLILGLEGTPLFKGYNIINFIKRFKFFYKNYLVYNYKATLLKYYNSAYKEIITSLAKYKDKSKT